MSCVEALLSDEPKEFGRNATKLRETLRVLSYSIFFFVIPAAAAADE